MRSFAWMPTGLATALVLGLAACGDSTREAVESERHTAGLVVGSAAAEWSLLTVPRGGGPADLRPLVDPDSVVWNGSTELPVAAGVWPLGEAGVVVLGENGRLVRYDAPTDEATGLASLSSEARPAGVSTSAVVFVDSAGRFAYEVGRDYAHGYDLPAPAAWAGPIEGGLAVLTQEDPPRMLLLRRADTAVVEVRDAGRPPALVTAWGRRVVVTGPSGRAVRIYSTDEEARLVGEVDLAGTIRALEASPSSHELYVALESPARIERISRFSLEVHRLAELRAAADRIRPGLFGGSLIARTPDGPVRVRTGSNEVTPLAGQWRSDLPLGLPGDLSIALIDDEARLLSLADSAGVALAGGSPRWWIPLRFNPVTGSEEALREALDDLGAEAGGEAGGAADGAADAGGGEPGAEDIDIAEIEEDVPAGRESPPGYYAIVASTRQREGVEALLATLAEAGYPTRVQRHPDQAGEVWHRGLVGPFPSRARAQAAARQLLRERDLQAWVTEIGATE